MNHLTQSQEQAGYAHPHNPLINKGTAFTDAKRQESRLEGLLPPAAFAVRLQAARRYAEIAALGNDLQKHLVLSDPQARNENLFHALLMSNQARYMPPVYTPTVGEAWAAVPRPGNVGALLRAHAYGSTYVV